MKMTNESAVLPATDRRSPFFVNVPLYDSKPIDHLIQYFKLWKHFIFSLIMYLKDLVLAKEFDLNLNAQLIASVQFPGYKDLPYRCMSELEQVPNYSQNVQLSPKNTPKNEVNKTLGSNLSPTVSNEPKRPNLPRAKSASSFLKNQSFAHRRSTSSVALPPEAATEQALSKGLAGIKVLQQGIKNQPNALSPQNSSTNVTQAILAAMVPPKSDIVIDANYFPPDSLFVNMSSVLVNHHKSMHLAQVKLCREVTHRFIPNLEQLHRNLGIKIKEIKSLLRNDSFANVTLVKEVSKTGQCINDYVNAIRKYSGPKPIIKQRNSQEDEQDLVSLGDPFLIKLSLDHQLKSQLIHENYIFALYVNLQSISKDLLTYVIKDLNNVAEKLIRVTSSEAVYASSMEDNLVNLGVTLKNKLKGLSYDWEYFVSRNKNLLNIYYDTTELKKREIRSFKDVVYPFSKSIHGKCLRCGYIYRKQKLMKSYVSYFYVLTCNYLHEFKIDPSNEKKFNGKGANANNQKRKAKGKVGGLIDHDDTPTKSYNLNDYLIEVKDPDDLKFVLTKVSGNQRVSFKCQNSSDFLAWSTDLKDLLKFSTYHLKRFKFIEEKLTQRAISSEETSSQTTPVPEANGFKAQEMTLNLKSLLPSQASLDRIQSSSLNGAFTPKVESPNEQANPFDNLGLLEHLLAQSSSMPPSLDPVTSPEAVAQMQQELEKYLQAQNKILAEQQRQLGSEDDRVLTISRTSSEESMSLSIHNSQGLPLFLGENEGYVNQIGKHHHVVGSLSSLPEVFIQPHEPGKM